MAVPTDLSIVGFNSQEFVVDTLQPGLTTVALPHEYMGKDAARRLITRPGNHPSRDALEGVLAPCEIVNRESVSAPLTR
jgi:LacI family transcriptional regulator